MSDVLSWLRSPGPFLIGHRGVPGAARENTPPSFEAALEAGCDGVELDVHLTRDRVPVVHHDATAVAGGERITLADIDWADLQRLGFDAGGENYRVYGLDQVLAGLAGRTLLNVELKPPGAGRHLAAAEALAAALSAVRPRESVLVSSFDPDALAVVRRVDKSLALGWLFSGANDLGQLENLEVADHLFALHPHHALVEDRLMRRARERGLMVNAWTVDTPEETARVAGLGAHAVITNRPDLTADALYEVGEENP